MKAVIFLFVFLVTATLCAQERGIIFIREATSVSNSEKDSIVAIYKIELDRFNINTQVIETTDITDTMKQMKGYDRYFVLDIIRLGEKYIMYFSEIEPLTGEEIFGVKHSTLGLDELDIVARRIVKAVLTRTPFKETENIENLSSEETRVWRKKFGEFYWGFGIPFGFNISPGSSLGYGFNLTVLYEMKNMRVDLYLGSAVSPKHENGFAISTMHLSLNYIFFTKNVSPYVGAGLGYGFEYVKSKKDHFSADDSGGVIVINTGVEMFRFHKIRLFLGLKTVLPLFKLENNGYCEGMPDACGVGDSEKSKYVPTFLTELTFVW